MDCWPAWRMLSGAATACNDKKHLRVQGSFTTFYTAPDESRKAAEYFCVRVSHILKKKNISVYTSFLSALFFLSCVIPA